MLFEKVLRRLCPCYYARSDESQFLCATFKEEDKEVTARNPQTERFIENTGYCCPKADGEYGNENSSAVDYWGGSFDIVHPQPLYALPSEKGDLNVENKSLLQPPLYWKKTMKSFDNEGPPVFAKLSERSFGRKKVVSLHKSQDIPPKYCETLSDIRSVSSETKEVYWLKSQSLHDLPLDTCVRCGNNRKSFSRNEFSKTRNKDEISLKSKILSNTESKGVEIYSDDIQQNGKKFRVIPDISYGVIVFSAAYHSTRRLLLLKIDRLENLSLKGRSGNTYNTIIKLSVSPSDKYFKCTKVLKKSTSPEVNEEFRLTISQKSGKLLRLSVFDAISQNFTNAIGHALLSPDGAVSRHPKKFRMKLYRHTQPHTTPGNLSISLTYRPEENKFKVLVDRGKNLTLQNDKNVKLNTYVKGTLFSRGNKVKSKKSLLVTNSRDPKYNSTFTFQVNEVDIDDLLMVISVRLKSFVRDALVGRVILGPYFVTDQKKLTPWGRVFLKHELVSHWFRLYL